MDIIELFSVFLDAIHLIKNSFGNLHAIATLFDFNYSTESVKQIIEQFTDVINIIYIHSSSEQQKRLAPTITL